MQRGSKDLPTLKRGRFQVAGVIVLWALAAALGCAQTTINVGPGQTYTTIQAGINAAVNGDTVLVAPGTYNENINFNGKAITVTSSGGAAVTTIDGGYKPGVATVIFAHSETIASVISGFTVRGGGDTIFAGRSDGGIYVNSASPTIQDNTVTANYCHNIDVEGGGAAILNNDVSGVLQSNVGTGPDASYCVFGSAINLQGTGFYSNKLGSIVIGNIIEKNITGNAGGITGAGINVWAAQDVLIMDNIIRNNVSTYPGSAFLSANSEGTVIIQNLIYGNSSCAGAIAPQDGGTSASNPTVLIANNTIVDNVATEADADLSSCIAIAQIYPGPYSYGSSGPGVVIVNNIISGSTTYPAVNCDWIGPAMPSLANQPTFENNILYNAGGPFFGSSCVDVSGQDNNISSNAQFVSPSTGDYHLKSTSPAIDSGANSVLQTYMTMTGLTWTTDFDGNPRVQDATGKGCIMDMGAYEVPGTLSACGVSETLISSKNPATAGQSITFTAQLSAGSEIPTGAIQFLDGANLLLTQTVSGAGSAAFTTNSLAVGSHTITANYQPTGSFGASTASLIEVIDGDATGTALISSLNPANVGQGVTFTATVTSSQGTPTGTVTFTDGTTTLSTANLMSGEATFSTSTLGVGTHSITATYNPSGSFAGSSAKFTETINGLADTTTLVDAPNPALVDGAVNLTATVKAASGTPAGTVMFYDGGVLLGTATLSGGAAGMSTAFTSAGTHNLTANYSGDAIYSPGTGAFAETVNLNPTTMTDSALPNPSIAFQPTVFGATVKTAAGIIPTGTVIFAANGLQVFSVLTNGRTGFSTSALTAGRYQIVASYAGDSASGPSSAAPFTLVVAQQSSQVHLASSLNPAPLGANVAFTAAVSAAGQFSGTVQFYDGTAPLGSPVTVSAQGAATYTTSALALGNHNITAQYSGDANTFSSVSAALQQAIVPYQGDFSIAVTPTAMSMHTGESSSLHVTVASIGGFNEPVSLSCGNLPAATTCSFSTSSLPNGQGTASVVIQTSAPQQVSANGTAESGLHRGPGGAGEWALALLAIFFVPRRWRRGVWMSLPGFCILIAASGCSSPNPIVGGTPPGTYQISITAAYTAPTPPLEHSAVVSLTVNSPF